jgi:hypothetical protein
MAKKHRSKKQRAGIAGIVAAVVATAGGFLMRRRKGGANPA